MSLENKHLYEFGRFRLDAEKRVLWHAGELVPLQPKPLATLAALVKRRGDVVTKDELMEEVWADSFVEEVNLSRNVHELRKILSGLDDSQIYIETVPRRGYRFAGQVRENENRKGEIIIEREVFEQTLIEEFSEEKSEQFAATGEFLSTQRRKDVESLSEKSQLPFNGETIQPKLAGKSAAKRKRLFLLAAVLLVILLGGFAIWRYQNSPTKTSLLGIESIAVLPLKSFASKNEDEELRLRITDALITKLGNLNEISARPTNSVLRFAGEGQDAVEIGKKLEVDAVLDGRVQTENNRLRVTLQLVLVRTSEQIWSEQFDGKIGEILALQDAIANRLRRKFAFAETEKFNRRPTENNEAYEAYLKGRYFWNQRTPDSYFKAIRYFEEAVRFDPNFALAYSGIADSYVLLNRRYAASSEEALPKAEEAARKAVELDDTLAEAHASMGLVKGVYNRNWRESEYHFRRAIELNPDYAVAYGWYGMNLSAQNRFDEAEAQMRKAERLDPTSRNIAVYLAANFYLARQFDRAIEQSRKALELDSNISTAYWFLSQSFEQKKMYDQAVEADLERQKIIDPPAVEPLREAFLNSGIKGFWRKQIKVRQAQAVKYSACTYEIATRHALLNEKNEALKIIEDNSLYGGTCWNGLNAEPAFDSLRSEPRFQEVLRKMNL